MTTPISRSLPMLWRAKMEAAIERSRAPSSGPNTEIVDSVSRLGFGGVSMSNLTAVNGLKTSKIPKRVYPVPTVSPSTRQEDTPNPK